MTSEAAKQHIEQIRRERFWLDDASRTPGDNPLMAMLRRALNQLATGIFEHAHHYIFELTQNADDNHYPESADRFLKFVLLENDPTNTPGSRGCLCVLNDETGFEKKDVESLCDIGNSTKQGNREGYIGEKGIGFKSVFLISDRPHIISNGYSFHFRQINCDAGLGYIVPHWNQQTFGIAQESPTAILLPLRSASGVDVAKQLADIEPECVLFLRRLRRIELVADQTGLSRTVKCVGSDGFFDLDADGTRARYFVHQSVHSCIHMNEPLREGVVSTCVTIALPLTVPVATDGRVFAFLPTEARTGFPFLINADFLLPASRERIFDTPEWNKQLVKFAAATFIETFEKLRSSPQNQTTAYCFIPTKSDLLPGASLFEPLVHVVHATLKESECIITESGGNSLPSATYFAGPMSRLLLADAPPKLATFKLVHPDLEKYRKRLEPLGIKVLTIGQVLDICNDTEWLRNRKIEWWETLFDLLSQNNITAAAVAEFPIFLCRDGECRRPTDGVFHHADGQTLPTAIAAGWPTAHLFDTEFQNCLQKKSAVWTWLTGIAGLRPFSTQSYITNNLLPWMCGQNGSQLVDATKFIATNLKHSGVPNDPSWRQSLRPIRSNIALRLIVNKIPWILSDGRVILPENRGDKQLITPECLEGENGWNLLFPALERHFYVLSNAYCEGSSPELLSEMQDLFKSCGATAFPKPQMRECNDTDKHYKQVFERCTRELHYGTPKLRDWTAPGWLLGLEHVEQSPNCLNKIAALERWIKEMGSAVEGFLHCYSKQDFENDWQLLGVWSEFGDVLRNRAWLQTSKGYVKPTSAFLDTPEFRDFFGDSVPYVATNILPELLQKLGVRVHMTTEILVGLLHDMSANENHDQVLLVKVYRRLQDSDFDTTVFRAEKLVFLAQPIPRWLTADKLVWEDAGQLFDADFGYLCLPGNYGNSELEHFFTQKLKIPRHPELRHYAEAWHKLCLESAADKTIAERKIKVILTRLSDSQDELSICDWWQAIKPKLHIWTLAGGFQLPKHVYVPDHAVAVELFGNSGRIHIAFPQKPARTVFGFLRSMSCPSLAGAVQPRLGEVAHESQRAETSYLTPAAKELCVSLVCSHPGWQERQPLLQALLKTVEVGVSAITIEYFFPTDSAAGTQQQSRDAYWDVSRHRLLLRDNVDLESLRDAAAKSIAAELFGEAASADLQSEFFRFLMASVKRARKLMSERSNWRLLPEQQQWLRDQDWKITVTELDEVEPPEPPRPPAAPLKTATLSTAINAATNTKASSPACDATSDQDTSSTNATCADSGQKESDSTEADVSKNEQQPNVTPTSIEPIALYDADSTTADFVEVRGYTRSRAQRSQKQQSREAQREEGSGLSAATADDKTALEKCGRDFATQKLKAMDYSVTPMSQNNPGFDLKAEKPGDVIKVEVKAHAGEANSVFVTQREWEEYLRTRNVLGETWELWNVENLAKSSQRRPTIQRIRLIPKSAMKESGYWINLKQCSQESPPPSTSSEKHL